jgi:hypothetical protein
LELKNIHNEKNNISFDDKEINKMNNVGRIITDFYCNGYFGRDYDFSNSVIIAEGDEYLVIRKENGIVETCNFQYWDWNRNEDGTLAYGISNLTCMDSKEKQKLIDAWCAFG